MNTIKERLAIAAALMLIAGQGLAQTTTTTTTSGATVAGTTTSANAGSFSSLSPGNQKIARSLFLAQKPTANGPAPLSLNQIAALKEKEGWGEVFKQMKAERLVTAKNLGQVVSAHEKALHTATTAGGRTTTSGGHHDRDDASAARGDDHHGTGRDRDDASTAGGGEHHSVGGGHDHDDAVTVVSAGGTTTASATGTHGSSSAGSHGSGTHGR